MPYFKDKTRAAKRSAVNTENSEEEFHHLKLPRNKESFGIVEQRLGASRIRVRCLDGKTRVCRIPGRLKRKLWVREGDTVVVEPWEFGGDDKGDIIFKYRRTQVNYLKRQGYLKDLADFEEF